MNKVVHFEIPAENMSRAEAFYKEVFDWDIVSMPEMHYALVHSGPTDEQGMAQESGFINGGIMPRKEQFQSPIIIMHVESIETKIPEVVAHGGSLVKEKMSIGEHGFVAYVKDTEGNVIGLWEKA